MIGETISHYRILEKLGEGGMGVVYRARDTKLDRDVAIKVLPEKLALDRERLERFEREAKAVAALNHPNIVTIYSVEEEDGVHFITMELVDGQTLSERFTSSGLSLDQFFALAIPLADAINSAHGKGVVHRDLKPANIMLDQEKRLKVLDFGLAKLFDADIESDLPENSTTVALSSLPTEAGKVLGTVDYMSPEQAEGKPVDHRADFFSLGVILYEMATGQRPFRGDSPASTISSLLRDTPVPVNDLKPALPHHLGRIISRCLEKSAEQRYQSAMDLKIDLEGLKRETESALAPDHREAGVGWRATRRGPRPFRIAGVAIVAVVAIAFGFRHLTRDTDSPVTGGESSRRMIAVLPFENLGPSEDEYFADGITEEIIARLASIRDLGVISRTSALQYKNTRKAVQEVGQELGVGFILEGTVRWQRLPDGRSRVRVTPQLIQVADATHLWADVYQEDMEDIFQVQSTIAERVAHALGVSLLEPERAALESKPTENIEAYHAYLRGLDFYNHPTDSEDQLRMAVRMFERAVKLDPEYSQAYCKLAIAHAALYYMQYDRTPARLALAKEAVDRALAIQPNLPEAHLALGWYYYWGFRDYDRALSEFGLAADKLPNNSELHAGLGAVMRRQGRWDEAIDHQRRACELDPQHSDYHANTAYSLMVTRRYAEAIRFVDRSILLAPDQSWAYTIKAQAQCLQKGDIDGALKTLRDIPEGIDINKIAYVEVRIMGRDFPAVIELLRAWSSEWVEHPYFTIPVSMYIGLVYRYMNDSKGAEAAFESARISLEALIEESPTDWSLHSSLGITYAGLNHKENALKAGRLATDVLPIEQDAADGILPLIYLAQIYTMVGEYDAALDQVEYLLEIPSELSVSALQIDPRWDRLRGQPRFQQILDEHSADGT